MEQFIVYVFIFLIEGIIVWQYLSRIFVPRKKTIIEFLSITIGYSILFIISRFENVAINIIAFLVINLIIIFSVYYVNYSHGVFQALLITILMCFTELLITGIFSLLYSDFQIYEKKFSIMVLEVVLSKFLLFLFLQIINKFFNISKEDDRKTDKSFAVLIIVPIFTIYNNDIVSKKDEVKVYFNYIVEQQRLADEISAQQQVNSILKDINSDEQSKIFNLQEKWESTLSEVKIYAQTSVDDLNTVLLAEYQSDIDTEIETIILEAYKSGAKDALETLEDSLVEDENTEEETGDGTETEDETETGDVTETEEETETGDGTETEEETETGDGTETEDETETGDGTETDSEEVSDEDTTYTLTEIQEASTDYIDNNLTADYIISGVEKNCSTTEEILNSIPHDKRIIIEDILEDIKSLIE